MAEGILKRIFKQGTMNKYQRTPWKYEAGDHLGACRPHSCTPHALPFVTPVLGVYSNIKQKVSGGNFRPTFSRHSEDPFEYNVRYKSSSNEGKLTVIGRAEHERHRAVSQENQVISGARQLRHDGPVLSLVLASLHAQQGLFQPEEIFLYIQ